MPFCENCGNGQQLEVDHVLPVVEFPELVYFIENLRVLCRRCNRARGHRWTDDEALGVLQRLQDAHKRARKAKYRQALVAAQRAVQAPGEAPPRGAVEPPPVRQGINHTPLTSDDAVESHYVGHSDQEVRA